jgi:hypothetical protein
MEKARIHSRIFSGLVASGNEGTMERGKNSALISLVRGINRKESGVIRLKFVGGDLGEKI